MKHRRCAPGDLAKCRGGLYPPPEEGRIFENFVTCNRKTIPGGGGMFGFDVSVFRFNQNHNGKTVENVSVFMFRFAHRIATDSIEPKHFPLVPAKAKLFVVTETRL